jgi:hypothetical protein
LYDRINILDITDSALDVCHESVINCVLDPKDAFSKQGLLRQGWSQLNRFDTENAMIEWNGSTDDTASADKMPKPVHVANS